METVETMIRLRVNAEDVHYGASLAAGAFVIRLFGDVATELGIRHDNDGGLLAGYDHIDLLAPVNEGDYLEVRGKIIHVGNRSRKMEFQAHKVISSREIDGRRVTGLLDPPVLVAKAIGTLVVREPRTGPAIVHRS